MNFLIREVDATDEHYAEELINLHDLTFIYTSLRPDLERGHWWLVYPRDPYIGPRYPVAFCGLTPTYNDPSTGYLKRVGVLKSARGHGLQRKLITVRERKARKLGMTSMFTDTTDNPPSANSLIGAGYKIFTPSYNWAFNHSIYWKKDLTK